MSPAKNEKDEDPGTTLRKRRTLRGHSLEAVHQHTRIPKSLLEAIENNDLSAFPAPVYYRGFLKNYCDFLETDFDALWRKAEGLVRPETPPTLKSPSKSGATPLPFRLPKRIAPGAAAALAVLLLIPSAWLLRRPASTPEEAARVRAGGPEAPLQTRSESKEVTVLIRRDTHLRLRVDGALRFEGRIPEGARQAWEAADSLSIRTTDPGAVLIEVDGRSIVLTDVPMDSDGWRTIER